MAGSFKTDLRALPGWIALFFGRSNQHFALLAGIILATLMLAAGSVSVRASDDIQWGGYLKLRAQQSQVDAQSCYQPVGTGTWTDSSGQVRLNHRRYFSDTTFVEVHYEITALEGDSRRKQSELASRYPDLAAQVGGSTAVPDDRRRLLNLTADLVEETDYHIYHRIDRLNLTMQRSWGDLRIGRQALTWGNGLVYNPMDLFNPFAPTDIERDYKTGDDMLSATIFSGDLPEIQVLCVPRRHPDTGYIESEQSALAAKAHLVNGETEFDLLVALNYGDRILGAGARGYLRDAAWRVDVVYTSVNPQWDQDDFISLVANLDYSWTWLNHNWYGLIEVYHNGAGHTDPSNALTDTHLGERLDRGDLFVLGKWYGALQARLELHPLVNIFATTLVNLDDHSGLLQPRITWDATENLTFTLGGLLYWGDDQTEYGGFAIPGTPYQQIPANSAYAWASWYF